MDYKFFLDNSYSISEVITKSYSTSFSIATSLLERDKRRAIYALYGFVRLADEIVDSFDGFDKAYLLNKLGEDLDYALKTGISTNTVLVAFVDTVKRYKIDKSHIEAFLESMERDLTQSEYKSQNELNSYIYGSADVVGLMCLKIFCNGDERLFNHLSFPAQRLGSAFQKVNFLRDLKSDMNDLGRFYFPEIVGKEFDLDSKRKIEISIESDFKDAWRGVGQLPGRSKLAVSIAYFYYISLFNKIKRLPPNKIVSNRIRVPDTIKYLIFGKVTLMYFLKRI